ncbi:MAG: class I SAM-dependent methyltransferase [Candidatus Hydrogenedentes bacterium]|nr:class I SAM-dependent methyltransferase [Candidatus Hydrogenedentota bacterium]
MPSIPERCPQCSAPKTYYALTAHGRDIVRCRACGVMVYWPLPTPEELQKIYDEEWESAEGLHCHFYFDPEAEEDNLQKNFRPRLAILESRGFGGVILDVGCSIGTFLKEAQSRGWRPEGIDLGEDACARTAQSLGCPVHHGTIETAALPSEHFDVIHASQVYEHVLDPHSFLEAAHRLLKPGGGLLLATPIIDPAVYYLSYPIQTRVVPVVSHGRMHGFPWGLHPPYHTFVQSTQSLKSILEQHGFDVVYVRKFPWNAWHRMNGKWRAYYRLMNVLFACTGSGQNIDILAVKR